jgi:hypothetical protein
MNVKQPSLIEHDAIYSFYLHPEGHVTASEHEVWVSAIFTNLEAASSWKGHFDEAERRYKEMNSGKPAPWGDFLGVRS